MLVCNVVSRFGRNKTHLAASTAHTPAQIFTFALIAAGTALARVSQSAVENNLMVLKSMLGPGDQVLIF